MNIRIFLIGVLSVVLCQPSQSTSASERSLVFVIGGFATTDKQMACWLDGASTPTNFQRNLDFRVFKYPSRSSRQNDAIKDGASLIRKIVEEINAQLVHIGRGRIVIVGHSSGAAVANQIASLVTPSDRVELINLDGFVPSSRLQKKVKTTCWYAVNTQRGIESRNARFIKEGCNTNARSLTNEKCENSWCLHVSLFELNIPPNLHPRDLATLGQKNCAPNLKWLETMNGLRQ